MTLLVIDRETGQVERISSTDVNFDSSIAAAAGAIGISYYDAIDTLYAGGELATCGYVRRLEAKQAG